MPVDKHACKVVHYVRNMVTNKHKLVTGDRKYDRFYHFSIILLSRHNLLELRWSQDKHRPICIALTTRDKREYDAVKERKRKLKIISKLFCEMNKRTVYLSISVSMYLT